MANYVVSLTGPNGDTITFDDSVYILERGLAGFGRPPMRLRTDLSASDGGVFRFQRRDMREIDMPITVSGVDRADVEANLRRLQRVLDNSSGTGTTLKVSNPEGGTWSIVGYFVSGANTVFGEDATQAFARWVIVLRCPNPFWTSSQVVNYSVSVASTSGRGLFNPNSLVNMKVTSSQVFGSITVDNPLGDVPSYPTWKLVGPFSSAAITLNGVGFTYTPASPVTAGNFVIVNTEAATIVDQSAANAYSGLTTAPKFFQIPSGSSTISVLLTGSGGGTPTSATTALLSFSPRKEVIH